MAKNLHHQYYCSYSFIITFLVIYLLSLSWRSNALGYMKSNLSSAGLLFERPYAAEIFLGTPAQKMFLSIDMGSDLVRFSCGVKQGETMPQNDTMPLGNDIPELESVGLVFNVNESSTFSHILCDSTGLCPLQDCSSETYCVLPNDKPGRSNTLYLSMDKLNMSGDFSDFMFACDPYDIQELKTSARGVLGLGRTEPSFFEEFGHMYDNCLSYCLPVDSTSTGYLAFGLVNKKCPSDDTSLVFTDLSVHPNYPSSYLIHITSITVNTTQISINSSSSDQSSGILVNPATFFTTLPSEVYNAMRDIFMEKNNSTVLNDYTYDNGGLDLCFDTSNGAASLDVPRVSMTFANDVTVELDEEYGIIYDVVDENISCLGFKGNDDPNAAPNVLGGMQQAKLEVGIDVANHKVGFRRKTACSCS